MYTLEKPVLTRHTNAPDGYSPKPIYLDSLYYDTPPITIWQYINQCFTYIRIWFTEWYRV